MNPTAPTPALFAQSLTAAFPPPPAPKPPKRRRQYMVQADPSSGMHLSKKDQELRGEARLTKSLMNLLNGGPDESIERLAFEVDPTQAGIHQGLWQQKLRGLPNAVLKRIAVQDHLVAAIVNTRANHMSVYGRERQDRHGFGFVLAPKAEIQDNLNEEDTKKLQDRIEEATRLLESCGRKRGWDVEDQMSFSQYLATSSKNAIVVGKIATEVIKVFNPATGKDEFHSFRPIDAGTIYKAAPLTSQAESLREQARLQLEKLHQKKLTPENTAGIDFEQDIAWIQVIEGRPVQAFTSDECLVHNFYPVTDVEWRGYPVTPIDTVISAVTTHINITTHNKLYFQSGRAARGILIIQSDDMDTETLQDIRAQFNAAVNSVQNSWRVPVLGVGAEETITWQATDTASRDMEFQYLADMTARVILSAFQMSPEELPGYAHLSRGTNNQALSESNNEYLLIAHRDVGLRPLVNHWQDFLNERILPLVAPDLVGKVELQLLGLDAETAEKESIRLQQDAPLHMTMNEILTKVEKDEIPTEAGGDFLFNEQWQAIADKYLTVGYILETFFGIKGASKDPQLQYRRDAFWFQFQDLQLQQQQMQMQAQQQQAQGGPPQGGGGGGGDDGGGGGGGGNSSEEASQQQAQEESQQAAEQAGQELSAGIDQAQAMLKSEQSLNPGQRKVLTQHKRLMDRFNKSWEDDSRSTLQEILRAAQADE